MPFIRISETDLHYELAGEGDQVLLLAHGNFASWRWWRPVLARLPRGFTAYAPDFRGCGDSERTAEGHSIQSLANDLLAFAGALRLPPLHLVGHSLGGAVALQLALDHPHRVRTLTLVAPAPAEGLPLFRSPNLDSAWLADLFDIKRDASLATLEAVYRFLGRLDANRPLLRKALARMAPTLDNDDLFAALVDDAARMSPEAMIGHLTSLDSWDVHAELGRVNLLVLVLGGAQDILISRSALERMVAGLPDGELVIWPDAGHAPQLEQPERFVQLLLGFILRKSRRASSLQERLTRLLRIPRKFPMRKP